MEKKPKVTEQVVPPTEKNIGLMCYVTPQPGLGGRIKQLVEDFVVREITPEGKILPISSSEDPVHVNKDDSQKEEYTVFRLQKYDWSQFKIIHQLSRRLRVSRKRFSFAGTKDRRALTIQRMSAWNVPSERLLEVRIKDVKISNPVYTNKPVELGDLWGNNFTIIIRDINKSEAYIENAVEQFIEIIQDMRGLPNFFGHQRFGTLRPITHLVGKALVQDNFRKAAEIFLTATSSLESKEGTFARKKLAETKNYKNAVKDFPKWLRPELAMINYLLKHPNDFINAFRKISKGLRLMFVHAFQSYIFNKFLSLRIQKRIPLRPVEGDIIQTANGQVCHFRELNEEEPSVVAPLVGYKTPLLPTGIVGELFNEVLAEEGVNTSMFHIKSFPEASSKGTYRALNMSVKDFQMLEIKEDPLNGGKKMLSITFSLSRGSYATVLLRELMKTDLVTPMYTNFKA